MPPCRDAANALTLVLVAALALSFGVQDFVEGAVIAFVIVLNTTYVPRFSFWAVCIHLYSLQRGFLPGVSSRENHGFAPPTILTHSRRHPQRRKHAHRCEKCCTRSVAAVNAATPADFGMKVIL